MIGILFISLFLLFFISVPIALSLGFSSVIALKMKGLPLMTLAQNVFEGLDSFL